MRDKVDGDQSADLTPGMRDKVAGDQSADLTPGMRDKVDRGSVC